MGEYKALGTLPPEDQAQIGPLMVIPPAGDFDPEAGRPLEPAEHIKSFGSRVFANWGRRPLFVDALYVDDERHAGLSGTHPLTSLLGRARIEGANACPATSIGRSREYQAAVAQFISQNHEAAACLRVTPGDLESESFAADIDALLTEIGCSVNRAVLLIDFAGAEPEADDDFIEILLDRLNHLPRLYQWLHVAFAHTAFPEKIKAEAGECTRRPRTDWQIYEKLIACGDRLNRRPIYSDYGLEYPDYRPMGRATPRARIRYSTRAEYVIDTGTTTKKPYGYKSIFPVADALTARDDFYGPAFSSGDAFFHQLSQRARGPGTAWQWRWAATDHHLRVVNKGLRALLGIREKEAAPTPREPEQATLF
jgi:hypothetical protein